MKNKVNNDINGVRIDKWLWAARFYKTRQLAVKALKNGKVSLNRQSVKPATNLQLEDLLVIKRGIHEIQITILGLSDKRGPAKVAQTLYAETEDSITAREKLQKELDNQPKIDIDYRKPDKRGVRSHRALKRGE